MVFEPELLEKRQKLLDSGTTPYPYHFVITHTLTQARQQQESLLQGKTQISLAGRVVGLRRMGKKVFFVDLEDFDGRLQLYLREQDMTNEDWGKVLLLDIGDWAGAAGTLFCTHSGELSLASKQFAILAKATLHVPISKTKDDRSFYQLSDPETRYRQRYLQWITDRASRQVMLQRARIISAIRRFLDEKDFLEVTTPTVELIYGGAEARPFETSIHALQQKAYLRISPELPLKKFIVGGFPKVYTICQNFRNEGLDRLHNPEFTMIEWYEAFTDYEDQMKMVEQLISKVMHLAIGKTRLTYQGTEIDFTPPWRRLTMIESLATMGQCPVETMNEGELQARLKEINPVLVPTPFSRGRAIAVLFEELCQSKLAQPTFIIDHPIEISPLTKQKRGNPNLVERFELFVLGMEMANAYSELTDPVEQYERFKMQRQYDAEAIQKDGVAHHPIDLDFVKAVGMGMPPTGGVGLGIDRLVMLLTDMPSIRDCIAFPMMRPKTDEPS